MKNLSLFALVALVLVVALAACGGGKTDVVPTESTSAEGDTGSQPAAATVETRVKATAVTVTETEAAPAEETEADLDLDNVSGGLDTLTSYKSVLDMRFSGKNAAGEEAEKSWTMEEEFTSDPAAQHVTMTSSESTAGQTPVVTVWETYTIGQTTYMISTDAAGTETCISISSGDTTPPTQNAGPDMWGNVSGARYRGTETVNGVRAKHYTWKEGWMLTYGYTAGQGETWVAVDGGYVVRQKVDATGKGVFLAGTDEEGTTTWQWDLTDANASFEILPPEGCESAAAGIPIMPDATDQTTFGEMISYVSPSAFADVVAFYKAEMPKAGWEASGTPSEMEGFATFEYKKEGSTASFMISWDESASTTSVIVTVEKE